jgi:hypothetical protein
MSRKKKKAEVRYFVGDFETTVYEGQTRTDVWASALVEMGTEDVYVWNSIDKMFDFLDSIPCNVTVYFHNLKFDGAFILDWLLNHGFEPGLVSDFDGTVMDYMPTWELEDKQFTTLISDMGQFYSCTVCSGKHIIKFIDSLKLIPMSVKNMGNSFQTKHRKTSIEYTGYRQPNGIITDEEKEYIANDVLVVKEALQYMFDAGHDKMTIGSCCMTEYKKLLSGTDHIDFETYFPSLSGVSFDEAGTLNFDQFIRRSYRGGWCYVKEDIQRKERQAGCTADVNSLYPSMMSSQSGNYYPIGEGFVYEGAVPKECLKCNGYYFQEFECEFHLKDGYLPFVQIKRDPRYRPNAMLHDSRGKVNLVFTKTDLELFFEHYEVVNYKPIRGVWFHTEIGIFDTYIDKYRKMKIENNENKGLRTIAKLFLNNLYGKMASSDDSSFKYPYLREDGVVAFRTVEQHDKETGYIACGSAITSYARNFTIRAAQKNYKSFCYADTDSIHCTCRPDELIGVPVHPTDFCHWCIETEWDFAIFTRQKTYIEHLVKKDGKPCTPEYDIKCAGMNQRCKELVNAALTGDPIECRNQNELDFINTPLKLEDFKEGLRVPSKLMPKRMQGGIVLVDGWFELRNMRMI